MSKQNYHKLPGGGIDKGEDIDTALAREILEETGCKIKVDGELGLIIEYRDEQEKVQLSYGFIANVIDNTGKLGFTGDEITDGFQLKWVNLDEAINLLENDKPLTYGGKFIVKRDLVFLNKAKENKKTNNNI